MIGVFLSLDLFLFYVFWDAMLIPMYFLIGIWGYDQRIYAAVKFMLYTMAGSVLMLVAILGLAYLHSEATGQLQLRPAEAVHAADRARDAVLVLPGVRAGVRDQGAAVPVPHLAARRARAGADRRLGHPGRRAAEDGHLRPGAVRVPAVPEAAVVLRAVDCGARGDRHRLRRAGRDGAAGHEEAGGLFVGEPPRLRRARHLRDERARRCRARSTRCWRTASAPAGSSSSSACSRIAATRARSASSAG